MITNDDGPPGSHSPFLLEFTHVLKQFVLAQNKAIASQGEATKLFVCVPSQNQSWVGKSVTRYSEIKAYCNWNTSVPVPNDGLPSADKADVDLWSTVE